MKHEKLAKSYGILPILSPNCAKFVFFFCHQEIKLGLESAFSDDLQKTSQMQNREERLSWKIKKWSWKSHGKILSLWEP